MAMLLALPGCSLGREAPPQVLARWSPAGPDGAGRIVITARATSEIVTAEALDPGGTAFPASLPQAAGQRDYGVAIRGSSDTGLSLGLSLDSLARAFSSPQRRRSATIPLPPQAAAAYLRSWRQWRVAVRFADGPTLVQPAPEPRP